MSLWQFPVAAIWAGSTSVSSPAFESLAAQTLQGIQGAQFALSYPRVDAGSWDGAGTQELVDRPRADLTISWVTASGINERALGFGSTPSGTTSALAAMNDERNFYLLINQDYQDAIGHTDMVGGRMLALGNGVLTQFSLNAAVGQPTTCEATIQGLNLLVQPSGGSGQPLPAIGKQLGTATTGRYTLNPASQTIASYFEAMPSAMQLTFDTGCAIGVLLSGQNACPIESFGFTIELPRAEAKDLGWAYPASRPVQWPATVNVRAEAVVNGFQLDALNRYGCPDTGYAFTVGFKNSCTTVDDFSWRFRGAKLEGETIGVNVGGGSAKVSLNWSLSILDINRVGLNDPNIYVIASGAPYTSIIFPQVDYVSGSAPLTFNLNQACFLSVLSGPGLLSGNSVFVTDEAATIVVRAAATDGSDTQDVTVTVS